VVHCTESTCATGSSFYLVPLHVDVVFIVTGSIARRDRAFYVVDMRPAMPLLFLFVNSDNFLKSVNIA